MADQEPEYKIYLNETEMTILGVKAGDDISTSVGPARVVPIKPLEDVFLVDAVLDPRKSHLVKIID